MFPKIKIQQHQWEIYPNMRHHKWLFSFQVSPKRRLYSKQWERNIENSFAEDISELFQLLNLYAPARLSPLKDEWKAFPAGTAVNGSHNKNFLLHRAYLRYSCWVFFLNLELFWKGKFHIENFPLRKTGKEKKKKSFFTCNQCNFSNIS